MLRKATSPKHRLLFAFALIFANIGGCSLNLTSNTTTYSQYTGSYTILAQNCYESVGTGSFFDINDGDVAPTGSPSEPYLEATLSQITPGWTLKGFVDDSYPFNCPTQTGRNVQSSDFTTGPAVASDFLWYTGHGGGGEVALYGSYPGELGPSAPVGGTSTFGSNLPNLTGAWAFGPPFLYTNPPPGFGAGLKWLFLNSSHSVNDDATDLTWIPAFNTTQNGIHGVYGFESEPSTANDQALAQAFLDGAVTVSTQSPNPMNVRTAWIDAAIANDSSAYGVWELQNSGYDVLSGPNFSGNPPFATESELSSSDSLNFYDNSSPGGIAFSRLQQFWS